MTRADRCRRMSFKKTPLADPAMKQLQDIMKALQIFQAAGAGAFTNF